MRVISGLYKGRQIYAGKDLSIRPVTTKIKASIFNTLGDFVGDKTILDLFSGSGGFGIEALSRGARSVIFVEVSHASIQILQENLTSCQVPDKNYSVIKADVSRFCHEAQNSFELILMDPPFKFSTLQDLVNCICERGILAEQGILVLHHEISNPILSENAGYQIIKQRKFGRNIVSYIMRNKDNET